MLAAYRWAAYAAFLASAALTVGWLANLPGWPVAIDAGPARPALHAFGIDALLLATFALQHSVMARPAFKRAWTRWVPVAAERSTYVLLASLLLVLLCGAWQPMPDLVWHVQGPAAWALQALCGIGWVTAIGASFLISHAELFGLRSAASVHAGTPLVERGLYRWVRHPIMTGFLLAFWATPRMSEGHLLFAAGMTLYILVGVALEERDLLAVHGLSYARYRARVGRLLPWRSGRSA